MRRWSSSVVDIPCEPLRLSWGSSSSSESGDLIRRLRPRIEVVARGGSPESSNAGVLAEPVAACCDVYNDACKIICGAEMIVLGGNEGVVGVDGSSEVDGEDISGWGRSSARTTSAGVPREY